MLKKFGTLYSESIRLGMKYPLFILFFILLNSFTFIGLLESKGWLMNIAFVSSFFLKITAQAAVGYVVVQLIRTGQKPEKIWSRGVVSYYWVMLKFFLLELLLISLTYYIPVSILGANIYVPRAIESVWLLVSQFLFVFLIMEAIFWEDKGLGYAYRMRNIFMLDRYEWLFPVYFWTRLPHLVLALFGVSLLSSPWAIMLWFVITSSLDWVNTIFTFKVYGVDRLQVAQEMEERVKGTMKKQQKRLKD